MFTIQVWADIQHSRLTTRNRLREPENRRPQRANPLSLQHRCRIQRRARRGNLDKVLRLRNSRSFKLSCVRSRVVQHSLRIVRLVRIDLQRDAPLYVANVGLAHAHADAVVDCEPALVFEFLGRGPDERRVGRVRHLHISPDVVACHVVWGDAEFGGHALGEGRVHPVYIDVYCVEISFLVSAWSESDGLACAARLAFAARFESLLFP